MLCAACLSLPTPAVSGDVPYFIERDIPLGTFASSSAVVDMNGDGIDDVVALSYRVLRINYGDPVAPLDSVLTMGSDDFQASPFLFVGDINNDSISDLLTGSDAYLGDGVGGYARSAHFGLAGVRSGVAGYINEDEYIDVVVGRLDPNYISNEIAFILIVYFGDENGSYDDHYTLYIPGAYDITPYYVHDFNHDGFSDIVVSYADPIGDSFLTTNPVGILTGRGGGFFSTQLVFLTEKISNVAIPIINDFNSDGFLDILVSYEGHNELQMLLNNGDGDFSLAWELSHPPLSSDANGCFVFDYDGDGDNDIGLFREADRILDSSELCVKENYGDGSFSSLLTVQSDTPIRYVTLTGDFNGDSHDDFIYEDTLYLCTDTPVVVESQEKPESSVCLHQNTPNPFNGLTVIPYSLNEPGFLMIKIFNILGQEVRRLASGRHAAGDHRVSWDGRDNSGESVANGLYYCVLKNNTSVSTIKINYLK